MLLVNAMEILRMERTTCHWVPLGNETKSGVCHLLESGMARAICRIPLQIVVFGGLERTYHD